MNKRIITTLALALGALTVGVGLTGCQSDSDTASYNLSQEAEQFRIERQITFYNAITDKYIVQVTGRCSIDKADSGLPAQTLNITCKTGSDSYFKDSLGKSDNVVWFSVQTQTSKVDPYHFEIIWKPAAIVPYVNGEFGKNGATGNGDGTDTDDSTTVVPTPNPTTGATIPGKTGGNN